MYLRALVEIERLWDYPDDSPENDKLDVLATLVDAYEKSRWPSGPVSPRDILDYAMTDMGRSQKELAELIGSRSQASDLLTGRPEDQRGLGHSDPTLDRCWFFVRDAGIADPTRGSAYKTDRLDPIDAAQSTTQGPPPLPPPPSLTT